MKKLGRYIIFGVVFIVLGCIAGDGALRCYSRLYLNEEQTILALNELWKRYPENRLDEVTIGKVQSVFPNMFKDESHLNIGSCDTCSGVFRIYTETKDFKREEWYIKSSNNELIFRVNIANRGAWVNGYNCDLCLRWVMFMDDIPSNFKNWELSTDKKRYAKKVFEDDILVKLKQIKDEIK